MLLNVFITICMVAVFGSGASSSVPISHPACGRRPLDGVPPRVRIVNGTEAIPGDWPWSVSFGKTYGAYEHYCGGILINNDTILSAAHCFRNGSSYKFDEVIVGAHSLSSPAPWTVRRKIKRITIHHAYKERLISNDIAIVKLAEPVLIDDKYIIPACLDESSTNELAPENQLAYVTGWGRTESGEVRPDKKRQSQILLLPKANCERGWPFYESEIKICSASQGLGGCKGDSGGPLVNQNPTNGRWYAHGIVSYVSIFGCGLGEVFTRVFAYNDWIKANM